MAGYGGEELLDAIRCSGPQVNECGLEGGASRVPEELEGRLVDDASHQLLCRSKAQFVHSVCDMLKAGKTRNCLKVPDTQGPQKTQIHCQLV